EALGPPSIPALKVGLNSDVPLVRFAAAEALAYLGSPSCGEELGKQVAEQPFVQAFALTALASLNEAVCRVKLEELLTAPGPERARRPAWSAGSRPGRASSRGSARWRWRPCCEPSPSWAATTPTRSSCCGSPRPAAG